MRAVQISLLRTARELSSTVEHTLDKGGYVDSTSTVPIDLILKRMDYVKHYNLLIEKAQQRLELDGYSELHHIVPRCMNGSDDTSNLVRLTAREHYVAHQLLAKMYSNHYGLAKAAFFMTVGLERQNNRCYGWVREKHAESMSISQAGESNSQYGTCWITNGEENKKIDSNQEIPEGWQRGRINPVCSEEAKQKISNTLRGKSKGKKLSEEHKLKISKACRGAKLSEGTRQKMSGMSWYNDGEINRKFREETDKIPDGFMKGRLCQLEK